MLRAGLLMKTLSILVLGACLALVSGAMGPSHTVFDLKQFPKGVVTTVPRPEAPDAHLDHQFAVQVEQSRQLNQVLQQTRAIQAEQDRVRYEKGLEDSTQYLCNLGLLAHPGCQ